MIIKLCLIISIMSCLGPALTINPKFVQLTPNEIVGEAESSNSLNTTGAGGAGGDDEGSHRLMVGDWIADWDFTYGAWFYYNTKTEKSTWEQPPEMNHIKFKDPKIAEEIKSEPAKQGYPVSPLNYPKYKFIQPLEKSKKANERVFLESANNEFFGLNTTVFKNEGVLNGVYNKLQDYYKDTTVDYLADVYSDAMDDYLGGIIQLAGWFFFGSFIVFVNEMMLIFDDVTDGSRSQHPHSLTDWFASSEGTSMDSEGNMIYSPPFIKKLTGLQLTFPIDNSFSGCYKDRQSCLDRDMPSEIDHLVANLLSFRALITDWIGFSETITNIVQEKEF